MVRLVCARSGWGSVRDPDTGEYVRLDDDVDQDVAERLADHYDPVSVDTDDEDSAEEEEDEDEDKPTCAGADGECSREVDSAGDYCWQHEPEPDSES